MRTVYSLLHIPFRANRTSLLSSRHRFSLPRGATASTTSRTFASPAQQHFRQESIRPQVVQSGYSPTLVISVVAVSIGIGYITQQFASKPELQSLPQDDSVVRPTHDDQIMATILPGRPGNLSPEQEAHLKELWLAVLDVFGVTPRRNSSLAIPNSASADSSAATSPHLGSDNEPTKKKKSKLSIFGKHDKEPSNNATDDDDKYGQPKEFKAALASQSPEQLRAAFWDMVKHDDPDALLLRFLRARKWNVHNALVMMVSTMHWRSQQMHVDDVIMYQGEQGFLKLSETATGADKKDAADVISQLRIGKSFVHGVDKQGRPITVVRARTHHPGENTEKSLEQYTVFIIETARMLLRPPVDTATIIFDMTSFSMSNMDYTPVKFMIKCFEANYPESLGSVLVFNAPWIFSGIWKIIKGWLDPVVAGKVHFVDDARALEQFVDSSRILEELGGAEEWKYQYIEPIAGENEVMRDTVGKEKIQGERRALVGAFENATVEWARDGGAVQERQKVAEQLRSNYWTLDPYIRARTVYDRTGVLGAGGRLDMYPQRAPAVHSQTSENDLD